MADAGLSWWEYMQHTASAYTRPEALAFAEVATHNHFTLDRSGWVVTQTAPVIKLPVGATEPEHLRLLGVLNSSITCFWLKQKCQRKGGGAGGSGESGKPWAWTWAFNSSNVGRLPLPSGAPQERARRLDALAREVAQVTPSAVSRTQIPTRESLDHARLRWEAIRGEMIAEQEELDWEMYRLYGLLDEDLTDDHDDVPMLALASKFHAGPACR
jgi:hypothetical protein